MPKRIHEGSRRLGPSARPPAVLRDQGGRGEGAGSPCKARGGCGTAGPRVQRAPFSVRAFFHALRNWRPASAARPARSMSARIWPWQFAVAATTETWTQNQGRQGQVSRAARPHRVRALFHTRRSSGRPDLRPAPEEFRNEPSFWAPAVRERQVSLRKRALPVLATHPARARDYKSRLKKQSR